MFFISRDRVFLLTPIVCTIKSDLLHFIARMIGRYSEIYLEISFYWLYLQKLFCKIMRAIKIEQSHIVLNIFIICCVLYFIALYIEINYLFTDTFYITAYDGINADIQELLAKIHSTNWLNFIIAPIYILTLSSLSAFALFCILTITNNKVLFRNCFFIGILGQLVFAINYLIAVILKFYGLIKFEITRANDVFYFQSLASIFETLPDWGLFACERISIIEIIYIIISSYFIHYMFNISFKKSLGIIILIELFMIFSISTIQICQQLAML